jgi:hypothetical protein
MQLRLIPTPTTRRSHAVPTTCPFTGVDAHLGEIDAVGSPAARAAAAAARAAHQVVAA